jgi:hypothetical protein
MHFLFLLLLVWCGPVPQPDHKERDTRCRVQKNHKVSKVEFESVMAEIAAGWNQNNAERAASCFSEDAIYSSVPNVRARKGRAVLYEWFGGRSGRPRRMTMEWHHFVFDPDQQIGVGEYTFSYEVRTHGLVILRIRNGLVSNWREYEQASELSWPEVIGDNQF